MGMYTKLVLDVDIKSDTSPEVIALLKGMCCGFYNWNEKRDIPQPEVLPDHPLFKKWRWNFMLNCMGSFEKEEKSEVTLKGNQHHLHVNCNFKNYEGELEAFLDWITPFVDVSNKELVIGSKQYEEESAPTDITFDNKFKFHAPVYELDRLGYRF